MSVVDLLKQYVNTKSVTPDDGGLLDEIASYLPDFKAIRIDANGVKNLFLYKQFGQGAHVCFAGHVDVVPAGEGWSTPAFTAVTQEGYIYGRGTQDMKSGVAAFVQAIKETKEFSGTLSILLTSDEEGPAVDGTLAMLKHLESINMLPDFAVVAEPTCETTMGDAIKVGRRGSINAVLTILGKQGHAAYPHTVANPVNILAPVLPKLAGHLLDEGDDYFEPSQIVITDIRGGMQVSNVTPQEVRIMFNIRNNTKTTIDDVRAYIDTLFDADAYTLQIEQSSRSFMTQTSSKIVTHLTQAIKDTGNITPKHSTAGGTSDARYFAQFGVDVVEYGVKNDRIHKVDERTSIKEVTQLYNAFYTLIQDFN